MTPRAYFDWISSPALTREREGNQPFIRLGKWGKAALRYALDKLGMQSASDEVDKLDQHSQGWYISIKTLAKIKETKKKVTELRELKKSFHPMDQVKLAEAKLFYKEAGIGEFSWIHPLIMAISKSGIEELTVEDLYLIGEESKLFGDDDNLETVEHKAIWLADMCLLRRYRKPNSTENYFSVMSSVQHAVELMDNAV